MEIGGEYSKSLISLVLTGAFIALAKLLLSSEELTWRVISGRVILGAATSLMAGLLLIQIPNLPPLALVGAGSALGILGQQSLEKIIRAKMKKLLAEEGDSNG